MGTVRRACLDRFLIFSATISSKFWLSTWLTTTTAWHESRAPGVHLSRRMVSEARTAKRMIERRAPLVSWPATFNSHELSGLIGWPIEAVAVPGLALGGCRLVPASPAIPRSGTVIGDSNFPGDPRPLAIDVEGRLRHVQLLGPTGTGKSTLLCSMALQDLEAGLGVVLLDPKGDLVQAVLERMPSKRRGDVIVLDPADTSRPVGLNPLRLPECMAASISSPATRTCSNGRPKSRHA